MQIRTEKGKNLWIFSQGLNHSSCVPSDQSEECECRQETLTSQTRKWYNYWGQVKSKRISWAYSVY